MILLDEDNIRVRQKKGAEKPYNTPSEALTKRVFFKCRLVFENVGYRLNLFKIPGVNDVRDH
jgi:hypothetical protein